MTDEHKRIRVRADDRERINRLREGPEDTQAAVVARALDALEGETDDRDLSRDAEVRAQLNRIEASAQAAESNTGSIQNTLENAGLGR